MTVRSPPLFVVSIVLLAAATTLGAVLIHDGQVGTDEARLAYAGEGDGVKVKGILVPFEAPEERSWDHVRGLLHHTTYLLSFPELEAEVLVTGLIEGLEAEAVVIEGDILYNGLHPDDVTYHLLVLDAQVVTEPYFSW